MPADFLMPAVSAYPTGPHHELLIANCLAQTEALMKGRTEAEVRAELEAAGLRGAEVERLLPHKLHPGNQPTNMLLFRRLDPRTLGLLIALYEHKTFTQGVIWRINSFDQWGVELGKQLATTLADELRAPEGAGTHDSSTSGLLAAIRALRAS
jgi:glucose-6-phosphate isomerase